MNYIETFCLLKASANVKIPEHQTASQKVIFHSLVAYEQASTMQQLMAFFLLISLHFSTT